MRAATNFLVANYGRQKIIAMARAVPKVAIFEEAARTLEIPGGVRMIQEYYRQMRPPAGLVAQKIRGWHG